MSVVNEFDDWFIPYQRRMVSELIQYLSIDTSLGREQSAIPFLKDLLESYGFTWHVEGYHPQLGAHSARTLSDDYANKANLRAEYGTVPLCDKVILFNSHIDVVPVEREGVKLLSPWVDRGYVYGRGACDTKGNLFLLLGALAFLEHKKIAPLYKVRLDLVSEEEVGGNGTLSTVLHGVSADLAIVFEPTNLTVHRGHRGCLTCTVNVIGKSVHMGSDSEGLSAISVAVKLIDELGRLESEMLIEAKKDPAFSVWRRPLQINIGKICGGEWPGSVPEKCELIFNVGFLPNLSIIDVEKLIEDRVYCLLKDFPEAKISFDFNSGLRNKAYLGAEDNLLLQHLNKSISEAQRLTKRLPVFAWRASCDARHYAREADIPTVIFGAGSLGDAHSSNERIELDQIRIGMKALSLFLMGS